MLTFAGSDVVEVQLVALLGSLQGALGGEEVAGGVVGLVVCAANLRRRKSGEFSQLGASYRLYYKSLVPF